MFIIKLILLLTVLSSKRDTRKYLIKTYNVNEGSEHQHWQGSGSEEGAGVGVGEGDGVGVGAGVEVEEGAGVGIGEGAGVRVGKGAGVGVGETTGVGEAPCTGTLSDWSCCSSTSPCQEKQGDCDGHSQCAGSLVCGKDNCKEFNPQAMATADCCIKDTCTGKSSDFKCCSSTSPCREEQGDCDEDSDCAGSLVCGKDNCRYFHPQASTSADCCTAPCTGTLSDWGCCSSTYLCEEKQGDCNGDSQCAGSLICGKDNCKDFNPQAAATADCCIKG